jgi:hypothetical protein
MNFYLHFKESSLDFTSILPWSKDEVVIAGFYASRYPVKDGDTYMINFEQLDFEWLGTMPRYRSGVGLVKWCYGLQDRRIEGLYIFGGMAKSFVDYVDFFSMTQKKFSTIQSLPTKSNCIS